MTIGLTLRHGHASSFYLRADAAMDPRTKTLCSDSFV